MSARIARARWLGCVLLAAACQTGPRDVFEQGQRAMANGDVLRAIRAFDAVGAADPRHAEARLFTAALELRLRRQLEAMLLGLELRATRHDEAALAAFTSAERTWPGLAAAGALADATRTRLRAEREPLRPTARTLARTGAPDDATSPHEDDDSSPTLAPPLPDAPHDHAVAFPAAPAQTATVAPLGPPAPPFGPPAPAAADDVRDASKDPVAAGDAEADANSRAPRAPDGTVPPVEPPASQLARLEAALANGEREQVLDEILALHRAHPDDARIRARLARLLQQRGLVAYGCGQVRDAIDDWRAAVALDPSLRSAQALLEMAAAELATPLR